MSEEPQIPGVVPADTRSKVEITRNSKGDPQWVVRAAEGVSEEEMIRLRNLALDQYREILDVLVPAV